MIVDTVLEQFDWSGSSLSNPDPELTYDAYRFIRELILDSHLYVTKVVGFYIKNKSMRSKSGTYIARNVQIGESYAEMMVKLSDKLFISMPETDFNVNIHEGVVKASDITDLPGSGKLLYTVDDICRVTTGDCTLCLKLQTNCGYRGMKQNSSELPNDYFPMNTYFNIYDYVRVLPMMYGSTKIPLRLFNGMTLDILKVLITQYHDAILSEMISEEELKWVYGFDR